MTRVTLLIFTLLLSGCSSSTHFADGTPRTPRGFEAADDPPFKAETHYAAGMLAESQGSYEAALAQYQLALQLDEKLEAAVFRVALLQARMGHQGEAIESWRRYIALVPQDAAGEANLGYTLELAGEPAEAEAAYRRAIAIDSRNETARVNLGLLLAAQQRNQEAFEHLSLVLPPAQAHYNIASVHEREGRSEEAGAYYRKALTVSPGFSPAEQRLAGLEGE